MRQGKDESKELAHNGVDRRVNAVVRCHRRPNRPLLEMYSVQLYPFARLRSSKAALFGD